MSLKRRCIHRVIYSLIKAIRKLYYHNLRFKHDIFMWQMKYQNMYNPIKQNQDETNQN